MYGVNIYGILNVGFSCHRPFHGNSSWDLNKFSTMSLAIPFAIRRNLSAAKRKESCRSSCFVDANFLQKNLPPSLKKRWQDHSIGTWRNGCTISFKTSQDSIRYYQMVSTQVVNKIVKLDHFPRARGGNSDYLSCHHLDEKKWCLSRNLVGLVDIFWYTWPLFDPLEKPHPSHRPNPNDVSAPHTLLRQRGATVRTLPTHDRPAASPWQPEIHEENRGEGQKSMTPPGPF